MMEVHGECLLQGKKSHRTFRPAVFEHSLTWLFFDHNQSGKKRATFVCVTNKVHETVFFCAEKPNVGAV